MLKIKPIDMKKLGISVIIILITFSTTHAQISQNKGQALFIYNFVKHIKWPNSPETYTIGVVGNNESFHELNNTLKSKQIEDKSLSIKQIKSASEFTGCQVIYVTNEKTNEFNQIVSATTSKNVLVITENDLVDKGAGISFLLVDNKLKFKINQSMLTKNGLQVSSGLLNLAMK